MPNADEEALSVDQGHASCHPTLTLWDRERRHSHTSEGYKENGVLGEFQVKAKKGKGVWKERLKYKGLYSFPLKAEKTKSCYSDANIYLGRQEKNF